MRPGALLVFVLVVGCDKEGVPSDSNADSDPPDTTPDGGWTLDDLNGACGYDDHVGTFELAQWDTPGDGFSSVTGNVSDGVIPTTILFNVASDGDCVLWQKVNPFCKQTCESDEACNHEGECIPYPINQDVGEVDIAGLTTSVTLSPDSFNNYWDTSVEHPLYTPGEPITVAAEGAFELRGLGVDTLLVEDADWLVQTDQDMAVTWTPGSAEARIVISFNIDQHGNSPVTMICETDDDGEASIPAELLEQLLAYGISGYASAWIRRRTADSVEVEWGCLDLLVYSHVAVDMTVEGHTPCSTDYDCPKGQHCEMKTQTCVDD